MKTKHETLFRAKAVDNGRYALYRTAANKPGIYQERVDVDGTFTRQEAQHIARAATYHVPLLELAQTLLSKSVASKILTDDEVDLYSDLIAGLGDNSET